MARIAVSVADNGPGVPEGDRARVFEPFYTTKSDGKGTGLGLSIVRNIVEQHGGEIRLTPSNLGGAEFTCLFSAASGRRDSGNPDW